MTAPSHPPPATFRQDPGVPLRTGVWSRLLRFWLSGRMLLIGIAGYMAGYLVMRNAEMQLLWLAATCHPPLLAACLRTRGEGITRDPLLRVAALLLLWNLTVGLVRHHSAFEETYTGEFFTGSLMLPVYLSGLWLVCRMDNGPRRILQTLAVSGAVAAIVGLIYWRLVAAVESPGVRLRNLLVHDGQHPVATAMCLSFAIVAGVVCYWKLRSKAARAGLLILLALMMLAVLLTLSRGALGALLAVPFAFTIALGASALRALIRKQPVRSAVAPYRTALTGSWPPLVMLAVVGVLFLKYGSLLAPVPLPRPPEIPPGPEVIQVETLTSNPLREYLARESSGRWTIYRLGLSMVDTWDKRLFGAGLWGSEIQLQKLTGPSLGNSGIDHFHSIFIATWIHGGIIGSALFLALTGLGVRRALALVHAGQPEWLAMLSFGLAALILDGQSMCSLITHPRFESLILWFPLIGAAACWSRLQTAGRQLSSSASR